MEKKINHEDIDKLTIRDIQKIDRNSELKIIFEGYNRNLRNSIAHFSFSWNKEKEIIKAQPDMAGKPENIVEKMMVGRVNKFLKENSLTEQPFVKNPDQTVGQLVKDGGATIVGFTRYGVGEGIEKEEADFAAEVAAQVAASKK